MRSLKAWLPLCVLVLTASGCSSLLYDLQPHRMRRINRHPAPSLDPEFSAIQRGTGLSEELTGRSVTTVRAQQ